MDYWLSVEMSESEKRGMTYQDGEEVHSGSFCRCWVEVDVVGGVESKWKVVVGKRRKEAGRAVPL